MDRREGLRQPVGNEAVDKGFQYTAMIACLPMPSAQIPELLGKGVLVSDLTLSPCTALMTSGTGISRKTKASDPTSGKLVHSNRDRAVCPIKCSDSYEVFVSDPTLFQRGQAMTSSQVTDFCIVNT